MQFLKQQTLRKIEEAGKNCCLEKPDRTEKKKIYVIII